MTTEDDIIILEFLALASDQEILEVFGESEELSETIIGQIKHHVKTGASAGAGVGKFAGKHVGAAVGAAAGAAVGAVAHTAVAGVATGAAVAARKLRQIRDRQRMSQMRHEQFNFNEDDQKRILQAAQALLT